MGPAGPAPRGAGGRPTWLTHSTGLRKAQLSRRSSAPSASRRWALRARAAPSNSQRKGAATESTTSSRAIPRASSTGTFSLTQCSRVSWGPGSPSAPAQEPPSALPPPPSACSRAPVRHPWPRARRCRLHPGRGWGWGAARGCGRHRSRPVSGVQTPGLGPGDTPRRQAGPWGAAVLGDHPRRHSRELPVPASPP